MPEATGEATGACSDDETANTHFRSLELFPHQTLSQHCDVRCLSLLDCPYLLRPFLTLFALKSKPNGFTDIF